MLKAGSWDEVVNLLFLKIDIHDPCPSNSRKTAMVLLSTKN